MNPSPQLFGLPPRFSHWRKNQYEAIRQSFFSTKRFVVHEAPTGFGKSVLAIGEALMSGMRTLVLTSTKGLQTQYSNEFNSLLVDVRGKSNYVCAASQRGGQFALQYMYPVTVDDAPCQFGESCVLKSFGCGYYDLLADAKVASIVLGNYSLWASLNQFGDGMTLGKFDLIVCDEAHELIEALTQALSVEFKQDELDALQSCRMPTHADPIQWAAWAKYWLRTVNDELEVVRKRTDRFSRRRATTLSRISKKFAQAAAATSGWLVTRLPKEKTALLQPVWPQENAESLVFSQAQKVLFTSATVRPKTLDLLGIKPNEADYFAYPSSFPVDRRPVYFLPTVRMHYGNTDADIQQWVNRVDQIIAGRLDRKGIVHTVSFQRQQALLQRSRFRHLMIANPPGSSQITEETVKRFKDAQAPAILVSPSVDTGFDFPYDAAEYVVIVKVPYMDSNAPLTRARMARDSEYSYYVTGQTLIQMAGRAMRAEDDQCEVFILDEAFRPYLYNRKHLLSPWFTDAIRRVDCIPDPPARLDTCQAPQILKL